MQSVQRCCRSRVRGIKTDANDGEEFGGIIMGIYEYTADLDEILGRRVYGVWGVISSRRYVNDGMSYRCH